MTNLLPTIVPKSDQLNADDLIGRSITITVSKVALCGEADQPIAVHYEGDEGKPYKPCKSMRRVMVHVWGGDGNKFAGRRMTLYRDDGVQWGGVAVGGIRISHMSDIDRPVTMALTATRANRKPYTVKPLAPEKGEPTECVDLLPILTAGRAAALLGGAALADWWSGLDREQKAAAKPTLDGELKATAAEADAKPNHQDSEHRTPPVSETSAPATVADEAAPAGADEDFPGDVRPSQPGEGAAEPSEPNGDEEKGSAAFDHIAWADGFIADLPFLSKEQLDALEDNKLELARFAQLKVLSIDKAQEFEDALRDAKAAFD